MAKRIEYKFRIDAYTPESIPMARLADYMADLSKMLGEPAAVHFVRLEEGSCQLVHQIEYEAAPKVATRIMAVRQGSGPPDALDAYKRINKKLREDNAVGALMETFAGAPNQKAAEIIKFPGRETIEPVAFAAFKEPGSLEGIPISVGGQKELVHVHLEAEGRVETACLAPRPLARQIAGHLFETYLRVHGQGRWHRDIEGQWVLETFRIESFEKLKDQPLTEVIGTLRNVKGNEWANVKDPWGEFAELRGGGNGKH